MIFSLEKIKRTYIFSIVAVALIIVLTTVKGANLTNIKPANAVFFGSLIVIANLSPIKLPRVGSVTITFAIHLACIAIFGPFTSIISEIISSVVLYFKRNKAERYKEIFNGSQFIICIFLGSLVSEPWVNGLTRINIQQGREVFLTSLIYFVVNTLFVTLVISLDQKLRPWNVWITNFKLLTPHYLTLAPLGFLVAAIYFYLGSLGLSLFLIPLLLARHSFKLYMDMRANYLNTIQTLIKSIEAKDIYTSGHSERVAKYSAAIGREIGLDELDLEQLNYLALLHDIGKVAISDSILNKVGKLDDCEFDIIKHHPEIGAEIAKNIKLLKDFQNSILHHHERWDGQGYPDYLKGEDIPVFSRIIAVADSFDAMTSDRSYRKALDYSTALQEIVINSGKQFDPKMVKAFINVIPEIIPDIDLAVLENNKYDTGEIYVC
ncbi:MAG: HD-GYP domain-containing protein [Peptococcaceae bacterium]